MMWKVITLMLCLCVGGVTNAQEDKPIVLNSYKDAKEMMLEYNIPGLLIFHAEWCQPCQWMHRDTFGPMDEALRKLYVVYYVDIDKEPKVYEEWRKISKITKIPAYAISNCGGVVMIGYKEGYLGRTAFTNWMNGRVRFWKAKQDAKQLEETP